MSTFKKFPSIEAFHHIYMKLKRKHSLPLMPTMSFRAKIKVHGTNAGIRVSPDGTVTAQKRTSDVTVEADNAGFARWVKSTEEFWKGLAIHTEITLFGEWAGPGVQKNVAVSEIEEKMFFIYALMIGDHTMIVSPYLIEIMITDKQGQPPENVVILPWYTEPVMVEFSDLDQVNQALDKIKNMVIEIDKQDPYFLKEFGVSGPGEGLVFVPCSASGGFSSMSRERYSDLMFKVKGESHQQAKQKNLIPVNPIVAKNISDFADMFVTEPRLQQGLTEALDDVATMKNMGLFLKWFGNDIKKESVLELEAAELEWKQVAKEVAMRAREWLIIKSQQL